MGPSGHVFLFCLAGRVNKPRRRRPSVFQDPPSRCWCFGLFILARISVFIQDCVRSDSVRKRPYGCLNQQSAGRMTDDDQNVGRI